MAMDVRRLPRNATVGFERVPNEPIFDTALPLDAIGLLARLLACRAEFSSFEEVAEYFAPAVKDGEKLPNGFGRDAYLSAARHLEKAGYVRRTRMSKGRGTFENRIEVSATPDFAIPAKQQVVSATRKPSSSMASGKALSPQAVFETGKAGVDTTCTDGAFPQVVSAPGKASSSATSEDGASPQVTSTTPFPASCIQTDSDSDSPFTPAPSGASRTAEGEAGDDDKIREASALVSALPANLQPGRGGRPELVAAIAALLALGWPAENLTRTLAGHVLPDRVYNLARLMIQWLPDAEPYLSPIRVSPPTLPPWCGECGAGDPTARTNPKFRTTDGYPDGPPCPRCHPTQTGTAA